MNPKTNLILDPNVRKARQMDKEQATLRFLRQHIWSTQTILQEVMGLSSRQAAHKSLVNMEVRGHLKRHSYDALGGKVTVWGITHQGQAHAFEVGTEVIISTYFEPNRVSEQTIRHELDLQRLRLIAESHGWKNWQDGNRLQVAGKNDKRPDAMVSNPANVVIAVECERTFKSLKRYEQILVNYLKLIKAGQINRVVWVCPTEDMALRLKKIITSIPSVRVNGQKVLIEAEKHHTNLYFCSYDEWPNYK